MNFSEDYASIYDALYQDKDYEAECDFLEQIFSPRHARFRIRTILDLGCGTGGHALLLAKRDRMKYSVTGVDRSRSMISEARRKAEAQAPTSCAFVQGDICNIDLSHTFDAVIAMFAVISYQTTNENLAAAFRTVRRHLEPGGLFVFDCWYGPAVLAQRPTDRYKVVERDGVRIVRYVSPALDTLQHTVQVNYKVLCLEGDRVLKEINESHLVRFLFPKEIEYYLSEAGLKLLRLYPFLDLSRDPTGYDWSRDPTEHDWNITVVSTALQEEHR